MGGRGGASGFGRGNVVIHKQAEPNKQGYSYYMTGTRNVMSNWDDDGNYHPKGIAKKEDVRQRFDSVEEAIKYAKKNRYKYLKL